MTDLEIISVDPFDRDGFDAWHAVYLEAERAEGDGVASPYQLEELRAMAQSPGTSWWQGFYAGRVGGRVVTTGWVTTPAVFFSSGAATRSTWPTLMSSGSRRLFQATRSR